MIVIAGVALRPAESGMAVMNRRAISVAAKPVKMHAVDISMCATMAEMRRFSPLKLVRLFAAPWRLIVHGVNQRSRTLYFVPSQPSLGGLLKDAWILLVSGVWFRHRIYHCHSGGVGVYLARVPGLLGHLLRTIIAEPRAVIRVSESAPPDDIGFQAQTSYVVANCIDEEQELLEIARQKIAPELAPIRPFRLLYIGLHSEAKGLFITLQALALVIRGGVLCSLETVGSFNDSIFESKCRRFVIENGLKDVVKFAGPQFGEQKVEALARAEALIFPTYFECESFGLVVAESMAAGIPAIGTDWSGLRDLIEHGKTGFLVQIKDVNGVAKSIMELAENPVLRHEMGVRARERFQTRYSQKLFCQHFRTVMLDIERRQ